MIKQAKLVKIASKIGYFVSKGRIQMKKNIQKKLTILFSVVFVLLGIMGSSMIFADETASITVGSATGKVGETVSIAISLKNLPEQVSGIKIQVVSYDKTKLELTNVQNGGLLNEFVSGSKTVLTWGSGLTACNTGKSGTAATLEFKLLDGFTSGTASVSVSVVEAYDMDMNTVSFVASSASGQISLKAHEHTYGEWSVTKEPTCTEKGEKQRTCVTTGCGHVETASIDANGHKYDGKEEVISDALCETEGSKKVYCSAELCNEYDTVAIPAKGHTKGDPKVEKEATCTETGKKVVLCTECTALVSEETIKALGHKYGDLNVEQEATCTEGGYGYKRCRQCMEFLRVELDALGHKFGKTVVEREASCTEDGYGYKPCEQCDEKKEIKYDKLGHEYGEVVISVEPTCEEKGASYRPCIRCEDSKDDTEIPALGHEYGDIVVETEATCVQTGSGSKTCIRCDASQLEVIPVLGHQYSDSVVVEEPTLSKEGKLEAVCDICQDRITEILPKLSDTHEHTFSEEKKLMEEATCDKKGMIQLDCTVENCDAHKIIGIPMESHNYGEWSITKEPTEEQEGIKTRTCTECKNVEESSIAKLPQTIQPELVDDDKKKDVKEYDWLTIGICIGAVLVGVMILIRTFLNMKRKK